MSIICDFLFTTFFWSGLPKAIDFSLRWYSNPAYYKEDEANWRVYLCKPKFIDHNFFLLFNLEMSAKESTVCFIFTFKLRTVRTSR